MHKITTATLFLLAIGLHLSAQSYNTATGVRLGTDWGLSIKQRIYDNYTGELILQSSLLRDETTLSLLATQHQRLIGKRFNLFFGGGIHQGWLPQSEQEDNLKTNPFGLDFIAGIDLTVGGINLSYDLKPGINLTGGYTPLFLQSGLSIRYVLVKHERLPWEPDAKTRRQKKREKRKEQKDKIQTSRK